VGLGHVVVRAGSQLGYPTKVQSDVLGAAVAASGMGIDGEDSIVDVVAQLLAQPGVHPYPLICPLPLTCAFAMCLTAAASGLSHEALPFPRAHGYSSLLI
jgi:hypothetical protein